MVPAFPRRIPENVDPSRRTSCCPHCMEKYEEELKVLTKEFENDSSENKSEAAKPPLPMWLQNAKLHSGEANAMNPSQVSLNCNAKNQRTKLRNQKIDFIVHVLFVGEEFRIASKAENSRITEEMEWQLLESTS